MKRETQMRSPMMQNSFRRLNLIERRGRRSNINKREGVATWEEDVKPFSAI